MEQSKSNLQIIPGALILIALAALTRFLPHPFNFTAVGAIALFSGATFRDKRFAFLLPIAIMVITDLFIGFHFSILPVYACFMITVWLGTRLADNKSVFKVAGYSILSSVIFFLVTNLPIWYLDIRLYPMTWVGTMESYTMALPFFRNQVVGDLFYNSLLFLVFWMVFERRAIAKRA